MICGIVDVGSNTIRLSIYRSEDSGAQLLLHRKVMAGLASYVEDGRLPSEGVQVICRTLIGYRRLLDDLGGGPLYVFATASLRNISNTWEVVETVQAQTGLTVDVISGGEEARLSFLGAMQGDMAGADVMLDLGGGSTELVRCREGKILAAQSLPIGALTLFDRFVSGLLPTASERKAIRKEVRAQLEREQVDLSPAVHLCGVGGTARAACKVANAFFGRPENSRILTAGDLKRILKRCKEMDRDTLHALLRLAPDRIHTLVPGMLVLDALCRAYGAMDITVSAYGVREGYLYKKILGGEHA